MCKCFLTLGDVTIPEERIPTTTEVLDVFRCLNNIWSACPQKRLTCQVRCTVESDLDKRELREEYMRKWGHFSDELLSEVYCGGKFVRVARILSRTSKVISGNYC